jgi:hypothetical protein
MRTPVVFIVFNRPEVTQRVFAEIARARPPKLLVIADGPRPDRKGEHEKCEAVRAIIDGVDWECEVLKNYSETNMGCARRPASGLRWAFEQVSEAIILEDDCLPHPSFFTFCEEMLERYRDDERVMHISGNNWCFGRQETSFGYSFSNYCLSWGWATWRRAFQHYDPHISIWPALRNTSWLSDLLGDPRAVKFWHRIFDRTHNNLNDVNTWDFQWLFACWANRGLSILPAVNVVANIGFGADATHTRKSSDKRAQLRAEEIAFPLMHPPCMIHDRRADQLIFESTILPRPPKLSSILLNKSAAAVPASLRRSLSALKTRLVSE